MGASRKDPGSSCMCIIPLRCNENPIYVFPEKELRGLSPDFHIHVSVSDLYIPRIGPQQKRQTDCENI
jgi:hypothetical protein